MLISLNVNHLERLNGARSGSDANSDLLTIATTADLGCNMLKIYLTKCIRVEQNAEQNWRAVVRLELFYSKCYIVGIERIRKDVSLQGHRNI